jgi:polyamine oxidase
MVLFNLLSLLLFCSTVAYARSIPFRINDDVDTRARSPKVLILGGGVAGIIAARTLRELGISDFLVIEAGDELGGRLKSKKFGSAVIELGANWLHGYGPGNPIYALAIKHQFNTSLSNSWEDICEPRAGFGCLRF